MDQLLQANEGPSVPSPREIYPPLACINRSHVDTRQAAFYLSREAQTLRRWACFETGPLRPVRVHGRLLWSVAELQQLLAP